MTAGWDLACPGCRAALAPANADTLACPSCGASYAQVAGIWRLMAPGRAQAFEAFVAQYERVRDAERRPVHDARKLRALPFRALSREHRYEWSMRAQSFRTLLACVVEPLERSGGSLRILDLGSGMAWLSNRLTMRGHRVAAVDLSTSDSDGLGAHRHYESRFLVAQAEFERLPFVPASVDLVVYNAAFHYSADYVATLREALRLLAPRGRIVIMDTPLYRDPTSGAAMVREREQSFQRKFGFRGDSVKTEGFLTYGRLKALGEQTDLAWELIQPWYGVRWWLKPWVARARRRREPASFKLVIGRRAAD